MCFIDYDSTLKDTMKVMSDWLHKYLDQAGSDVMHADVVHHAPFYAMCQSLFYVFCFRNQELMDSKRGTGFFEKKFHLVREVNILILW